MGVQNTRAALAGCASVLALCAASPGLVHADIPCKQWRFDGYTRLDLANGRKITFVHRGPWMDNSEFTVEFPANGGPAAFGDGNTGLGAMYGGIQGNYIHLEYVSTDAKGIIFQGGVGDDGFAYGTMWVQPGGNETSSWGNGTTSWRIPEPLRCADNGG